MNNSMNNSMNNTEDLEDIIKILIDLFHNEGLSFDELKTKVAEQHFCLSCKKHFNRCKCDNSPSPTNSDASDKSDEESSDNLSVSSSEVDDNYSSSPEED
jgi:hypothetical protein